MTDRELDVAIAEKVMGWKLDYEFADFMGAPIVPHLRDQYDEWGTLPEFSTNLTDAHSILPRIKELGRIERFVDALLERIDTKQEASIFNSAIELEPWHGSGWELLFDVLAASPEAICQAALEAVEGMKE